MTIICAVHEPGVGTWIGSDTAAFRDGTRRLDCGQKWTIRGTRAMGSSGSHVISNIIEDQADSLLAVSDETPFQLAQRLRKMLIDFGFSIKPYEGENGQLRAWVVFATESGVWHFTTDGGVYGIGAGHFCADGSGERYAHGAAHACCGSAPGMVNAALSAAIALCDGCGGIPFIHLQKGAA